MADVSVVRGVLILIPDVSGRWLCVRRSSTASAPGQVGFPGGKVEPGESPADAVAREGFEELGTQVTPLDPIATHYIPRYAIELTAWTAALDASQLNPSPVEIAEIVWLYPDEIAAHPEGLPSNPIFAPYLSTDPKVIRLLTRLRGGSAS